MAANQSQRARELSHGHSCQVSFFLSWIEVGAVSVKKLLRFPVLLFLGKRAAFLLSSSKASVFIGDFIPPSSSITIQFFIVLMQNIWFNLFAPKNSLEVLTHLAPYFWDKKIERI